MWVVHVYMACGSAHATQLTCPCGARMELNRLPSVYTDANPLTIYIQCQSKSITRHPRTLNLCVVEDALGMTLIKMTQSVAWVACMHVVWHGMHSNQILHEHLFFPLAKSKIPAHGTWGGVHPLATFPFPHPSDLHGNAKNMPPCCYYLAAPYLHNGEVDGRLVEHV